jgi:hypothetical protein
MAETQKGRNGGTINKGRDVPGPGRPRKLVTTVISEMVEIGIAEVTSVDVVRAYKVLLNCTASELKEVAQSEAQPFLLRSVAKSMLSGKGQEMIERMIDRAHGKPANILSMNTDGSTDPDTGTSFAGINIIITGGGKPPITREEDLPDH